MIRDFDRALAASTRRIGTRRRVVTTGGHHPLAIDDVEIWNHVAACTMTSPERIQAVADAVRHLERHQVPGAFVECGVWRGGSMMAAVLALSGATTREFYLLDTFDGLPPPG